MTTTRYDQDPTANYGKCGTCGITLPTEQEAKQHMSATFQEAKAKGGDRGHGIRAENPNRASRVQRSIDTIVEDAIYDAIRDIYDLVDADHITGEEVKESLKWHAGFADAWEES